MKKFLMAIMIVCFTFLLTVNAQAFPISAGETVIMNANWGDNYGIKNESGDIFNTFCLEIQEVYSNDTSYFVESVGQVAVNGGTSSAFFGIDSISAVDGSSFVAKGDPLSERTLWLYAAYFDGEFGFGQEIINQVQNAIWYNEEEFGKFGSSEAIGSIGYEDYNSLIDEYADGNWGIGSWDIQAVNIVGGPDKDYQSQLVGVNPVPEPATMMLFGLGLLGIAGVHRSKR